MPAHEARKKQRKNKIGDNEMILKSTKVEDEKYERVRKK